MKRGPAPTWIPLRRQLLDSSIWEENAVVCKLWVTLLIVGSEPGRRGTIDMTPRALAARACMSVEEVSAALEVLMAPDPRSRSRVSEGRRVELLDKERSWGGRLVNWEAYEETMAAAGATMRSRKRRTENATKRNEMQRKAAEPTKEKEKEKEKEKTPHTPLRGARGADPRFDAFFEAFPNRVKRKDAAKAWAALGEDDREAAGAAVGIYAEVWRKAPPDRLAFAGHPATWLRGERWKESRDVWERAAAPRSGGHRAGQFVEPAFVSEGPGFDEVPVEVLS